MLRSGSASRTRRLLRVLRSALLAGSFLAFAGARAQAAAAGPRLRLPEDGVVSPGEVVILYWDGSDRSIRELEILLSTDGGRHYAEWISPQLDPASGEYRWRVPDLGVRSMRFKIRFNRDGREIEGEPSGSLDVLERRADPVALPPWSEVSEAGPRAGAAGSDRGDPSSSGRAGPASREEDRSSDRASSKAGRAPVGPSGGSATSARSSRVSTRDRGLTLLFVPPRE